MAKNNNQQELYGFNIYKDKKGRMIYYDMIKKRAVYIPAFDMKMFSFYKYRYIFVVSAFIVLQTLLTEWFELNYIIPIIISFAILAILEVKFRRFIANKQPVKHFKKEECTGYIDILNTQDKNKMILKIILYIVLGVLLVLNAYDRQYNGMTIVFCWIIAIACCSYAIVQLIAMNKRK